MTVGIAEFVRTAVVEKGEISKVAGSRPFCSCG